MFENIKISDIVKAKNIRTKMNRRGVSDLAASIEAVGLRHPVTVAKLPDGKYQLREGYRRFSAVTMLGRDEIPAHILEAGQDDDKDDIMLAQLVENIQREDLSAIDEAKAIKAIIDSKKMKSKEIAALIGKSQAYVSNRLAILRLSGPAQVLLGTYEFPRDTARHLVKIPKDRQCEALARYKDMLEKAELDGGRTSKLSALAEVVKAESSSPKANPPKANPPKANPPKANPPKANPPKASPPKVASSAVSLSKATSSPKVRSVLPNPARYSPVDVIEAFERNEDAGLNINERALLNRFYVFLAKISAAQGELTASSIARMAEAEKAQRKSKSGSKATSPRAVVSCPA
jgi:ParB/RepB/Spo0J family partition protein